MTPDSTSQPLPAIPSISQNIPPPPVFGAPSQGNPKPGVKSATPTFLGTLAVPSQQNKGTKQLVGQ